MKLFFLISFSILRVGLAHSQNCYDCQWRFGINAGLDFTSGSPVAVSNSAFIGMEACASIADSQGNLLFYSKV